MSPSSMPRTTEGRYKTQVLVIGSGLAGLTAALTLADHGVEVLVLAAGEGLAGGNTPLAQGGVVESGGPGDERELENDILTAGWRHNYAKAVRFACVEGPKAVREFLVERLNVPFARDESGELQRTKEGGHSRPRILYCKDFTGKAIHDKLLAAAAASPNIRLLPRRTAVDILTSHHHSGRMEFRYQLDNQCLGAYVFNEELGRVETILADATLLATGGLGQIYLHTTNAAGIIGSGLAMAFRANAKLVNAEYVQFHPTALYQRSPQRFLVSEAVRGEGARLLNSRGETFMTRYDPRADLAPRDIVTRAIMEEMLQSGDPCVYLDAATYARKNLAERFPTIHARCLEAGVDMTRQPIPVVPAAHYFCGGVLADERGRTTIERLYAAGEVACTGVHGANRLASVSLLESLLWGRTSGEDMARKVLKSGASKRLFDSIPDWTHPDKEQNEDPALIAQDWATIRTTMWNYVGVSRSTPRLKRAFEDLRDLNKRLHDFYKQTPISKPIVDLFHGCQSAHAVTLAAMLNPKSLGCHYRIG